MKKTYKKIYKKIYKKTNLSISFLNFNFVMIQIIHKILVLIKNHMDYFKDNIFEFLFKKYNRLLFFKKIIFFQNI